MFRAGEVLKDSIKSWQKKGQPRKRVWRREECGEFGELGDGCNLRLRGC